MLAFDASRYLAVLRRWWWLLVLGTCLAAGVSYLSVRSMPPVYVASTTIMVGEAISSTNPNTGDFSTAQMLADTYASLAQREPILDATVKALKLPVSWEEVRAQLLVIHPLGSQTFELRVQDVDPNRAMGIAQGIAIQLIATSPTEQTRKTVEERQQFIHQQLDVLQQKIVTATGDLEQKQSALAQETSARGVLDRQDEIRAIELNLTGWRASYASLLNSDQSAGGPNTLTVIEPATLPRQPAGTDQRFQIAAAGFAGLLLAIMAALALEFFDNSVKTKEELERLIGAPTLTEVSLFTGLQKQVGPVISISAPAAMESEAYRMLSTSLRFAKVEASNRGGTTLVITSPRVGDGKSLTAANVAAALAQQGSEVLLVDLDLRGPSLHKLFGTSNKRGLTTAFLIRGGRTTDNIIQTELPLLSLLPTGQLPPNPGSFIGRVGNMLMDEFREMAEFIVIDTPPLLAATDAVTLAGLADATLLVARAGVTSHDSLRSARQMLERANARIVGGVLNAVSSSELQMYSYAYNYGAHRHRRGWATLLQRFTPPARP